MTPVPEAAPAADLPEGPPGPGGTEPPPVSAREAAVLAAILLLALALRLVNFGWGIPLEPYTGYYHPDERKIVQGAMDFPGDILTRSDLRYPTAYHYALGLASAPLRAALPRLAPGLDPFLATFVLARASTLLLALGTVLGTWWLGRRWYGPGPGLAAAAAVAVTLVHVVHGAYATLDVPTSFLAVAALWACDRVLRRPSAGPVALAALLSGLLVGTKYPGGVILVPGLLAIGLGEWRKGPNAGPGWPGFRHGIALAAGYLLLAAGVALLTTPTILLHPEHLQAAIAYEGGRQGFGDTPWGEPDTWLGAVDALEVAAGPVLGLLYVAALAALLFRPGGRELLLLGFILPYYMVLGERVANRYLILLVPAFALALGRLLALALALGGGRRWLAAAFAGGLGLALLAGLWASAGAVATIQRPDLRSQAARTLAEQAPAGARVCLSQANAEPAEAWKEPPVSAERYRLVGCGEDPDWVITIGGTGRLERALESPLLGADYGWDPAHRDWWPEGLPAPAEQLRFYDRLLPGRDGRADYALVAEFEGERLPTVPFDVSTVKVWRRAP